MRDSSRKQTLEKIALAIGKIELPHPVRVGIDGMSASGKTSLADELAGLLKAKGKKVVRAGLDGFHNTPEVRHRQGPMSAQGYVEDSFDYLAVREKVLQPLGPAGSGCYCSQIFDHQKGESIHPVSNQAPVDSILLFEGVMLFRKELVNFFDYRILVMCSVEVILERAKVRDLAHFGDIETLLEKYEKRFIPGQNRYFLENKPDLVSDILLVNDDPQSPTISTSEEKKG